MGQHVGDIGSGLVGRPWAEDEDRAAVGRWHLDPPLVAIGLVPDDLEADASRPEILDGRGGARRAGTHIQLDRAGAAD
jgi:hypothetical protein